MGKHAASSEVTEGALNRNLSADQFHQRSGGMTMCVHPHSSAGKRPKHEASSKGPDISSAGLRARGL